MHIVEAIKVTDVKITVVRMLTVEGLTDIYSTPGTEKCSKFNVGDEFISKDFKMPNGFCEWAWTDIQRDVAVLASGGDYPWCKKRGIQFSCCTSGLTPVIFKLERTE